jgi:antitoxin (DNA-binding transcriptional repressor) of toxin-antitoxin stability system
MADDTETAINVTAFKGRCLALIDAVARGRGSRVVLTRGGQPVAAQSLPDLWGAMRGTVKTATGADITQPTGETWKADA